MAPGLNFTPILPPDDRGRGGVCRPRAARPATKPPLGGGQQREVLPLRTLHSGRRVAYAALPKGRSPAKRAPAKSCEALVNRGSTGTTRGVSNSVLSFVVEPKHKQQEDSEASTPRTPQLNAPKRSPSTASKPGAGRPSFHVKRNAFSDVMVNGLRHLIHGIDDYEVSAMDAGAETGPEAAKAARAHYEFLLKAIQQHGSSGDDGPGVLVCGTAAEQQQEGGAGGQAGTGAGISASDAEFLVKLHEETGCASLSAFAHRHKATGRSAAIDANGSGPLMDHPLPTFTHNFHEDSDLGFFVAGAGPKPSATPRKASAQSAPRALPPGPNTGAPTPFDRTSECLDESLVSLHKLYGIVKDAALYSQQELQTSCSTHRGRLKNLKEAMETLRDHCLAAEERDKRAAEQIKYLNELVKCTNRRLSSVKGLEGFVFGCGQSQAEARSCASGGGTPPCSPATEPARPAANPAGHRDSRAASLTRRLSAAPALPVAAGPDVPSTEGADRLAFVDVAMFASKYLWKKSSAAMLTAYQMYTTLVRRSLRYCRTAYLMSSDVSQQAGAEPPGNFLVVFKSTEEALKWCVSVQLAIRHIPWPSELAHAPSDDAASSSAVPAAPSWAYLLDLGDVVREFGGPVLHTARHASVRCTMGVHEGHAWPETDGRGAIFYHGFAVMKAALLCSQAEGGQIAVSGAAVSSADHWLQTSGCTASDAIPLHLPASLQRPFYKRCLDDEASFHVLRQPHGPAGSDPAAASFSDHAHNPNWWLPFANPPPLEPELPASAAYYRRGTMGLFGFGNQHVPTNQLNRRRARCSVAGDQRGIA